MSGLSRRVLLKQMGTFGLAMGCNMDVSRAEVCAEDKTSACILKAIDALRESGASDEDGAHGGLIRLPRGAYAIDETISLPMGVSLVGEGRQATRLMATSKFPRNKPMIEWKDEKGVVFGSKIEGIELHGQSIASIGLQTMQAQEGCIFTDSRITACRDIGIRLGREAVPKPGVVGSAAEVVVSNSEVWMAASAKTGIEIINCSGAFSLRHNTVLRFNGGQDDEIDQSAAVRIKNSFVSIEHLHWETFAYAVYVGEGAKVAAVNVEGGNAARGSAAIYIDKQGRAVASLIENVTPNSPSIINSNSQEELFGLIMRYP